MLENQEALSAEQTQGHRSSLTARKSRSLEIYPPAPKAIMRVHLRDAGQDFLYLDIAETKGGYRAKPGHIIAAAWPFQSWMWAGKRVKAESLVVGGLVAICLSRQWTTLKYPIIRVEHLATARATGAAS